MQRVRISGVYAESLLSAGISYVQELAFQIVWRWFAVWSRLFVGTGTSAACGASGSAAVYVYGVQVDLRCAVMKLG